MSPLLPEIYHYCKSFFGSDSCGRPSPSSPKASLSERRSPTTANLAKTSIGLPPTSRKTYIGLTKSLLLTSHLQWSRHDSGYKWNCEGKQGENAQDPRESQVQSRISYHNLVLRSLSVFVKSKSVSKFSGTESPVTLTATKYDNSSYCDVHWHYQTW